jgi:hypothetical protein
VILILTSTPLSLITSVISLFVDRRKSYALAALFIGGVMAVLLGGSLLVALTC